MNKYCNCPTSIECVCVDKHVEEIAEMIVNHFKTGFKELTIPEQFSDAMDKNCDCGSAFGYGSYMEKNDKNEWKHVCFECKKNNAN